MGKLIVLEGTDGSGKSTQFHLLTQRLEAEGVAFTAEGRVDWTRSMWDGQAEARDAAHEGGLPPPAYIKGRRR